MILDDIAQKYGVDTSIAYHFASEDPRKMFDNLCYFLDKYSDSDYTMAILFGDNRQNVYNFVQQLKKDCKLAGAYSLHLICKQILDDGDISIEYAKEVRNSLKRVTDFWELYIPKDNFYGFERTGNHLAELMVAISFDMNKNVEYIISKLKNNASDSAEKRFYMSLEDDYLNNRKTALIDKIIHKTNSNILNN